jgi:hypothetical protein
MRGQLLLLIAGALGSLVLASCVNKEPERKPVPPPSTTSKIPWNSQGPSGGGGQFGALPQNQYRR